jgi:putative transposase
MRYMLTDELWAALEPLVEQAKVNRQGPPPTLPDRQFYEALLYLARTGIPWRDLPAEFGNRDTVYNRFRRFEASGGFRRQFELLTAAPALGEVRRVFIDSTIVLAHQHAAGVPRSKKKSAASARRRRRPSAAAVAG